MIKYFTHKNLYLLGILTIMVGLPLSPFLMTMGQVILIANWIIDSTIITKIKKTFTNKATLFFILIIIIHLFGLLYTSNFEYAWRDLRVKWPLLFLPIIFSSTPPLLKHEWRTLFKLFGIAVIIGTLIGIIFYIINGIEIKTSARCISLFISHIRFSLMICLTIFIFAYITIFPSYNDKYFKYWAIPSIIWLMFFLLILGALTGFVILILGVLILTLYFSSFTKNYPFKLIIRMTLLGFVLIGISFFIHSLAKYQYKEKVNLTNLPTKSKNGTPYKNNLKIQLYENGHLVYIYVASSELQKEWEKRSSIPYDGKDKDANMLKHTLIRYLASKNLRRDSTGIAQLTDEEINAIENGISNCIFLNKISLYPYLYRVFWEFDRYLKGGNPTGSSIIQRVYYAQAGLNIFKQNPIIGVGTGDISDAFHKYYKETKSILHPSKQLRSHNQYISIMVAFGSVGLILFLLSFIYPILSFKKNNLPFIIMWTIAMISMLNEDTLETQAGALFVSFFISFFYWGIAEENIIELKFLNKK